jgi:hypothetical protein
LGTVTEFTEILGADLIGAMVAAIQIGLLLSSHLHCKNVNIKICKTMIIPVVLYGCACDWVCSPDGIIYIGNI